MVWTDLAQVRDQWKVLVNTVTNLRVLQNFGKFLSSSATGGFSRWVLLHGVSQLDEFHTFSIFKINEYKFMLQ